MVKATPQKSPKSLKNKSPKAVKTPMSQAMKEQRTPKAMTPKLVKTPKVKKTPAPVTPEILKKTPDIDAKKLKTKKLVNKKIKNGSKDARKAVESSSEGDDVEDEEVSDCMEDEEEDSMENDEGEDSTEDDEGEDSMEDDEDDSMEDDEDDSMEEEVNVKQVMSKKSKKENSTEKSNIEKKNTAEPVIASNANDAHAVFVANIGLNTSDELVSEYFSKFGKVTSCKVARSRDGKSKGYAFISFANEKSVKKVLNQEHKLGGKDLTVQKKKNTDKDPKAKEVSVKRKRDDDDDSPPAKRAPVESGITAYVGNLNFDSTEESVTEYFSKFGEVSSCVVPKTNNNRSKGFAFVSFADEDTLMKVLESQKKHTIDKRQVFVKRKLEKLDNQKRHEVILRNLDVSVDKECIEKHFSKYGNITKITLPKGISNNVANQGFAFVAFSTKDEMDAAIKVNSHKLANKKISCTSASSRKGKKVNLKHDTENQVVVTDLSTDLKFPDIKKHFETFGSIRCLRTPKKQSLAYITFVDSDSVDAALAGKHKICGKLVKCSTLKKKENNKSGKSKMIKPKDEEMETDDDSEEGDDNDDSEGDDNDDSEEGDDNDDSEEGDDNDDSAEEGEDNDDSEDEENDDDSEEDDDE